MRNKTKRNSHINPNDTHYYVIPTVQRHSSFTATIIEEMDAKYRWTKSIDLLTIITSFFSSFNYSCELFFFSFFYCREKEQ